MQKYRIRNLYRVTFSGSRKPIIVIADNFGEAAKLSFIVSSKDEISCEVMSITLIDNAFTII